jgi:hypothetical protein
VKSTSHLAPTAVATGVDTDADAFDTAAGDVSAKEELPAGVVSAEVEINSCPPDDALVTPAICKSIR